LAAVDLHIDHGAIQSPHLTIGRDRMGLALPSRGALKPLNHSCVKGGVDKVQHVSAGSPLQGVCAKQFQTGRVDRENRAVLMNDNGIGISSIKR